jgi:hypothetical protein
MNNKSKNSIDLNQIFNKTFDKKYYKRNLKRYGIKLKGKKKLLNHFQSYGKSLQLSPNKIFDTSFYLMQYPDIRENSVHPYRHYLEFGWIENRKPNSRVCEETVMTQQYLKQRSYVELELEKKFLRRPRFGKEIGLYDL